jgi:hypothetical protein
MNKFYSKFIKERSKLLPDWFFEMAFFQQTELLEAHFIITDMCFEYQFMKLNIDLLYKLKYFRKDKGILFADQIEVIKRNIDEYKPIPIFELLRKFEPEAMFIEQCNAIKQKREMFLEKVKDYYDVGININSTNKDDNYKKLIRQKENLEQNLF